MAKISPVSIKYMIHASFSVEGSLEKPDVIGAIFGQTEGLLGADLEMRELQKEGKIGRIEVDLERRDKRTMGKITIPTALDQSETTLIAAAVETIDRIGPSDAQIEVEKIEDVRGSKRDYILERAKKLMGDIKGSSDSREITKEIKESARTAMIQEYGESKLPCGDISEKELIVVEGRADVVNLLRNNVNNVIAMNGTKLPNEILALGKEKEITLFVDGDRGGKLIVQNVTDNTEVKYVAVAPDGKEVEELQGKEILIALRKRVPVGEFLKWNSPRAFNNNNFKGPSRESPEKSSTEISTIGKIEVPQIELTDDDKRKLKDLLEIIEGKNKAILLDANLKEIKTISSRGVGVSLSRGNDNPVILVVDGPVTKAILSAAEEKGVQIIVGSNFGATSEKVKLISF